MSRVGNVRGLAMRAAVLAAVVTAWAACGGSEDPSDTTDAAAPLSCRATESECGSRCADVRYDPDNCGACGVPCNSSEVCSQGACALTCQTGLTECARACVNLRSDLANCGACGRSCLSGEVCSNGTCAATCQSSLRVCSETCVNPWNDRFNCGDCGRECGDGLVCSNGACEVTCQHGLTECDGICENLRTSLTNCGACSRTCAPGDVCSSGSCSLSCQEGLSTCANLCVNLLTDNGHCGDCFEPCESGQLCTDGECNASCKEGTTECEGTCVDLAVDERHCGQCGTECLPTEKCYEGACALSCPSELSNCGGVCVDTDSDVKNCGQCGTTCPAGQVCDGIGTCAVTCAGTTPNVCNGGCVDAMTNSRACGVAVCQDCDLTTGSGSVCEAGVCACKAGAMAATCSGACVDLETDVQHCGDCGTTCGAGQLCVGGACTCPSPMTICDGACTNTAVDPAHCGGCVGAGGAVCTAAPNQVAVCAQGECDVTCAAGYEDCDGIQGNGCELAPCANLVFLTNAVFLPTFGGVAVGDAACQTAAETAGIPGTFKAWLSDTSTSPDKRFTHPDRPYVRKDGKVVAANWAHLTSGNIGNAINITETGQEIQTPSVLTGTRTDGTSEAAFNCDGWTSTTAYGGIGHAWVTTSEWSLVTSSYDLCEQIGAQHLYCFQQ